MKKIFSLFAVALMSASMFADPNIVTPTISGETEFTDSVIVTMSCPSPNADIYYTTDGTTDPKCDCAAAPEYKKPIIIRETTVIKAAAYDGNDWSGVAEVTFTKVAARPDTAYGVTHEEEDVMALYCNHYTTNNLNFTPQGWGTGWQTLSLAGTNVAYTTSLGWDAIMGATDAVDLSAYKHLHFDVWAPDTAHVSFTIEAKSGYKQPVDFKINPGWNTIDADPAWWNTDSTTYDWRDVKCVLFEKYKKADGETSFEGNPFAFANIYMWNDPAPKNIPATAPAAPTRAESKIQALFSATYKERTFNFAPTSWGTQWVNYKYTTGEEIYHTESMAWDGFTNWDASSYNLTAYDMMHADVYVTVDSKLKFTFEALGAGDGGSGWKNGASFDLVANQWNSIDIDLLNAPFDSYDFTDLRYLILEGFVLTSGATAEGTPLSIANVYFWNSMDQAVENVEAGQKATKRLIDGKLVIEKNGVRYNAIGTKF